jgi:uncharacterized protein YcbX
VITVEAIHLAPVKSLGLVHPHTVHIERHGIAEDRRFYVIDQHGRLVTQRTRGQLVQVTPYGKNIHTAFVRRVKGVRVSELSTAGRD